MAFSEDLLVRARPCSFASILNGSEANLVIASPAFLRVLLLSGADPLSPTGRPTRLFFGGGALLPKEIQALVAAGFQPQMRYGFTECAHVLSSVSYTASSSHQAPGYVGQPLPGVEWKIENGFLRVRAPGIAAAQLREGVAHSLSAGGWFTSDDQGELLAHGGFTLRGREYEQITAAGFRFTPAEVEAAIVETGLVKDALVFAFADALFGERPVALVVPSAGVDAPALPERLNQVLARALSRHKIPFRFVAVARIPRSASGKRDLAAARSLLRNT